MTLPTAPPRIRARPAQNTVRPGERSSSTDTTMAATRAKVTSSGVCQPPAPARKLNAAPLLNASTRLKKPVTSSRSPGAKRASTTDLVSWSASTMPAETRNQGQVLDMRARLSRAVEVRPAASAQAFAVDIGQVVPAPLAFWMLARLDLHSRLARAFHVRCGGDQQVLQLGAEAG